MCHFVIAVLILSSKRPQQMVNWMWAESVPGRQVTSTHTLSTVLSALQLTSPVDNSTDHKFVMTWVDYRLNLICVVKLLDEIQLDVGGFAGNPLWLCWSDQNSHWSVSSYLGKLHNSSETGLVIFHSFRSLSYDRSIASSKASSPQSAI